MTVSAIVLAAGAGTRMRSSRPKPLHVLCGRPMLLYVLDALSDVRPERTVIVVGHGAEAVTKRMHADAPAGLGLEFVEQVVQRGTGDAVTVGLTAFSDTDPDDDDVVLVLPGDTPLLTAATISSLVHFHHRTRAAATVLTADLADPTGYGRVVRDNDDRVKRVVEHKDATAQELAITEINTGIYCFRRNVLGPSLRRVTPDNSQGEYYLTDVLAVLRGAGYTVSALTVREPAEAAGVNDRVQLAEAESVLRTRTNQRWLAAGVTMVDPGQTYIDATVELGTDVTIFPGTLLQGRTVIGSGCEVGPDARLVDTVVGDGAIVENCVSRSAEIGAGAHLGAYSVLEPGDRVPAGVRTGPFYTQARSG